MAELPRTLVVVALRAESAGVFEAADIPVLRSEEHTSELQSL